MLAAGLRFYTRTGRVPKREDFRGERRKYWERLLGFKLPSDSSVYLKFKGFSAYQRALGFIQSPHALADRIEEAAIQHVLQVYPEAEVVKANTNAYDLLIGDARVEVKGSVLSKRNDNGLVHCTFKLHKREFSKTVDAVFLVCLDKDYNAIARFEFRGRGLRLLDNKSTITTYPGMFFGGHSQYRPYLAWFAPIPVDPSALARESKPR